MANVLIPLANGFEDVEAITVIDVLRRGGMTVVTASLHETTEVLSAHGVTMKADARLADVVNDAYDAIVLPGGALGTEALKKSDLLLARLKRQREEDRFLCAICAAPTVLLAAGIIGKGLHLTSYPTCQMEFDCEWAPVPVVADGKIITGQAPGSALLFSLVVLQALAGQSEARKVARAMVTDVLD